jgi:hypothetical protein
MKARLLKMGFSGSNSHVLPSQTLTQFMLVAQVAKGAGRLGADNAAVALIPSLLDTLNHHAASDAPTAARLGPESAPYQYPRPDELSGSMALPEVSASPSAADIVRATLMT